MAVNSTCFAPKAAQEGPPLIQNGRLVFQTHDFGWIAAGLFTIVACVISFWLVNRHLQWYTNKSEQRYIVRILFMVPLYAIISLASYLFWDHSTAILLIRDGYESTVLTAFFYLLLTYLSPNPDEQKIIFRDVGISQHADREAIKAGKDVRKWMFPLGWVKKKPADGLYFLQMMKWGVLQYCVIRPTTTLAAVILNYIGWYCESSWSPVWGYVYITIIISTSVSIAMYCLIQVYVPIAGHLAPHKPLLKLFAIKAVVFLTFWQATFLSLLSSFGVIKDTTYMTAEDINTGISAILECFEMMLFAFLHLRAFTYKPYVLHPPHSTTPRLRSLGHAFDFRETFREIGAGCMYIIDRMKGREARVDVMARRAVVFQDAFGQGRPRPAVVGRPFEGGLAQEKRAVQVEVRKEVDVDVGGERQWLGIGDDYGYGLAYARRREKERSDGLGEAIEKELEKRGVDAASNGDSSRPRASWWRGVYNRLSQSGPDPEDDSPRPVPALVNHSFEYDDAPPPSIIHTYRIRNAEEGTLNASYSGDVLGPLPPSSRKPRNNTKPSQPAFERSDSLLARVFPYASSTDLAVSEGTHGPGAAQVKNVGMGQPPSRVVITSGDDPGRVLSSSPEPGELPTPVRREDARRRPYSAPKPSQHRGAMIHGEFPVPIQARTRAVQPSAPAGRLDRQVQDAPQTYKPIAGPSHVRQSAGDKSRNPTYMPPRISTTQNTPITYSHPSAGGDSFDPKSLYDSAQHKSPTPEHARPFQLQPASMNNMRSKQSPPAHSPPLLSIPAPLAATPTRYHTSVATAHSPWPSLAKSAARLHYDPLPSPEARTYSRR